MMSTPPPSVPRTPPPGLTDLPMTGGETAIIVALAVALIVLGALLLAASRKAP